MSVQLGSAYGEIRLDAGGVRKGTRQAESSLLGLERRGSAAMTALGLSVGAMTAALIAGGKKATSMAAEFQTSMKGLELAAADTGMTFQDLRGAAIEVGGDTRLLGVSATGAAEAMDEMYRSGLNNTVMFGDLQGYMNGTAELGGALRASIDMAAASTLDMVAASELATGVLGMFGNELETDAEKAEFVNTALDNMVRAANASKAEVTDMRDALGNVGTEAARLGFSIEDTNNALALLSTYEIKGAEAGTALKSMLLNMSRTTDKVTEALDELNVELYDQQGQMRSLPEIIGDLELAFANLTDEQRDQYMQTLAGTYGIKALSALVLQGTDGWHSMADATARATSMQEQASTMANTYEGKLEALEGNVETLAIKIGEKLLPVVEDWVDWATEYVDENGDQLVTMVGNLAEILQVLSDALQGQGSAWQTAAVRVGGFAVVAGGLISTGAKVTSTVTTIGTALKTLRVGAGAAEAGTLGLTAALGPLSVALLAVGSAAAVAATYAKVQRDAQENTAAVTDRWTGFLEEQAAELESAEDVADAYARKQEEIGELYDEGGLAMRLFTNRTDVLSASTEGLNDVLMDAATDYDDYLAAVEKTNKGLVDQSSNMSELAWAYDQMITPMSRTSFELLREDELMESGFLAAQMMSGGVEELAQTQTLLQRESAAARREQEELGHSLLAQIGAFESLGAISREEAALMRDAVVDDFGQITTASGELSKVQEALASTAGEAWTSFANNVREGVQGALGAYRSGNEEMLAEQQAALGQMILNQAELMVATGDISQEQIKDIRLAVHEQYGIVVDETSLASDQILAMFSDMAAGGGTSIDDLISFIQNIGEETDAMAKDVETDLAIADQKWADYKTGVQTYGSEAALAAEEMAGNVGGSIEAMGSSFDSTVTKIGNVEAALLGLPAEHTFTLHLKSEGSLPDLPSGPAGKGTPGVAFASGTNFAPGGWSLVGEEGPELEYVPRGAQILNAQETAGLVANAADIARQLQAGGMAGGADGTSALQGPLTNDYRTGPQTVIYDQRTVEMPVYPQDQLDMEFLARRVAEVLQRRR